MLPLQGVRVADFCWVWIGPYCTKLMSILGAEVIKIEGHRRTDMTRHAVVWPLPDPTPTALPPNQGMSYNCLNMGKKSVTLDLAHPRGVELAKRVAALSDIVVDNLRAGFMDRIGLGYADLHKIRPDIIVVSCSSRGQEGPESGYGGYANIHHAVGGASYVTGYANDVPCHSASDPDLMNGTAAAFAALVALYHRRRTGEGQFIDYSQCEGVTSLIGELLLGYEMSSQIPERMGNAHPAYAPHNVYPCWGADRWLALEVHSDDEFAALANVIGRPQLAGHPRFANAAARKENEAELDHVIEQWTRVRDRDWMVNKLCRAGIAAAPSRDGSDLYADPHLRARQAFVTVQHPELGELEFAGSPWRTSDGDMAMERAPLLGEHNDYVLRQLLGLSEAEVDDLRREDVIL